MTAHSNDMRFAKIIRSIQHCTRTKEWNKVWKRRNNKKKIGDQCKYPGWFVWIFRFSGHGPENRIHDHHNNKRVNARHHHTECSAHNNEPWDLFGHFATKIRINKINYLALKSKLLINLMVAPNWNKKKNNRFYVWPIRPYIGTQCRLHSGQSTLFDQFNCNIWRFTECTSRYFICSRNNDLNLKMFGESKWAWAGWTPSAEYRFDFDCSN